MYHKLCASQGIINKHEKAYRPKGSTVLWKIEQNNYINQMAVCYFYS